MSRVKLTQNRNGLGAEQVSIKLLVGVRSEKKIVISLAFPLDRIDAQSWNEQISLTTV